MLTIQRTTPLALHVLLPGLTERADRWARDYGSLPRVAALEAILSRGSQSALPVCGFEATLCWLFGLTVPGNRDLPLGALRRFGFKGLRDTGFWLCADPVSLRADVAHVFLTDSETLSITWHEARRLASLMRSHFNGDNWILETDSPACWHLRLSSAELIRTYPQRALMGKPIEGYLPSGTHARRWRGFLNEVQMLFHGADVNLERKRRVEPPINGLWMFGAGELPGSAELRKGADVVWSDDRVAIGLSRLTGTALNSVPRSLAAIMTNNPSGIHLVSLASLLAPASYNNFETWHERLDVLESTWFAPILRAISAGKLTECHIYDCVGRRFSFTRTDRWRAWRGIKPLQTYLSSSR